MTYCSSYRYGAEDGSEEAGVPPQDRPAGQDLPLLVKHPSHVEVPVQYAPEADIVAPTHPDPDSSPRIMTAAVLEEAHPGDGPARGALQGGDAGQGFTQVVRITRLPREEALDKLGRRYWTRLGRRYWTKLERRYWTRLGRRCWTRLYPRWSGSLWCWSGLVLTMAI